MHWTTTKYNHEWLLVSYKAHFFQIQFAPWSKAYWSSHRKISQSPKLQHIAAIIVITIILPVSKWQFEMHFRKWQFMHFEFNFTDKSAMAQVRAWHQTSQTPLPKSMLTPFRGTYMRNQASMSCVKRTLMRIHTHDVNSVQEKLRTLISKFFNHLPGNPISESNWRVLVDTLHFL